MEFKEEKKFIQNLLEFKGEKKFKERIYWNLKKKRKWINLLEKLKKLNYEENLNKKYVNDRKERGKEILWKLLFDMKQISL